MPYEYGENDVLTLKGAAAQQTTHPGNITYYKLCEQKYPEYAKEESSVVRRNICIEIVKKITNEHGGVFRKYNGAKMDAAAAVNKTMDRFRQIRKPKIVAPKSVGENDVVFKVGAANHLFPGNAKWRLLLDQHVHSYWPELFPASNNGLSNDSRSGKDDVETETEIETEIQQESIESAWKRVRGQRPYYQVEISHKLIDIIEDRGGKFRNAALNVMEEREGVLTKIHERFKDIKKYIKNGTYQSPVISNKNLDQNGNGGDIANAESFYVIKRTGCTSTKATVIHSEHHEHGSSAAAWASKKNKRRKKKESEDVGDASSDEGGSHGSLDSMESFDDNTTFPKRSKEQAQARRERAHRRKEAIQNRKSDQETKPKAKRKRKKKPNGLLPPELPDHEMSDYEKLRFEKMQRNYNRMVSLGLCAGATAEV
ncbi:unnamed protein product [Cylindrotheca closterium]|uniref:DUF6824 domain-containing protein n=1 Tax=Cylindrotheca closterium TaxID=2856 RepID=A0AAD2JM37_9STRA|nr:unnamed protein product [Cylindrotheca closterium]